jgi:hypothetical protein
MEQYINDAGKLCFKKVEPDSKFSPDLFHKPEWQPKDYGDESFAFHTNLGSITVLNRMTGFGHRDTETGFRDKDDNFWLASGMYDVRESYCKTVGQAIDWIKQRANTCDPDNK